MKKEIKIPQNEELYPLSELYKSFSDVTRLRILSALSDGELCVGDIADSIEMTVSAISHQLKILKNARLVKGKRDGKQILYSLSDDHVRTMLMQGLEHIRE